MHFSIYKKNITPIGFCLLLYFVTFRYKKCTEPTINIFYENMCHFTTAVCLSGVARTWSRSTLQSFQDFRKYPLHVFSRMCGFLCFSQMDAARHCHARLSTLNHSIAHCLICHVHRQKNWDKTHHLSPLKNVLQHQHDSTDYQELSSVDIAVELSNSCLSHVLCVLTFKQSTIKSNIYLLVW